MDDEAKLAAAKEALRPKKVLCVLSSKTTYPDETPTGFWLAEATHPLACWTKAGWTVDICSITGTASADPASLEVADAESLAWHESNKGLLAAHPSLADIASKEDLDYDVLFFCGGYGAMWDFPEDEAVKTITKTMYEAGKIVRLVPWNAACRHAWMLHEFAGPRSCD